MAKKAGNLMPEAQWAIMHVVWENKKITSTQATEKLKKRKKWAYSTVKTLLDRMAQVGLLKVDRPTRTMIYSPAITEKRAKRLATERFVNRVFAGDKKEALDCFRQLAKK